MQLTHFHQTTPGRTLRNLWIRLVALDMLSLTGLVLLTELASPPTETLRLLSLWLICGAIGWMLGKQPRHALMLDTYLRAVLAPLITGFLVIILTLTLGYGLHLQALLIPLLWCMSMGLNRLHLRRQMLAFRVGVISQDLFTAPPDPHLEYVPIQDPHGTNLKELDALLINPTHLPTADWFDLILHAQAAGMPVWTSSQLNEELYGRVSLESLHSRRMDQQHYQGRYLRIKRALDLGVTILLLPVLLPLLGAVAVIVLLDAGRPVLFWQERVGQKGTPFWIAKFRTMRTDSESAGAAFATSNDARITRTGRMLRKFRLDELPQFYNVLRGDMSIIGPRPEQVSFVRQFEHRLHLYHVRHWVKPGITGWAQVRQGYAAGSEEALEKLRFDMYYVKHLSFALDLRVVTHTVLTVLTGFGAR